MPAMKTRPRSLGIFHMRQPIGAWVSILHRITGVLLVLTLPLLLYALTQSLASQEDYARVTSWFAPPSARLLVIVLVWLLVQHFLSGLRHLLFDLDIGTERLAARRSARIVLIAGVVVTAVIGYMLW
jgi:succinate dehydrogenase / fumarate reductase cytochrome b subunit